MDECCILLLKKINQTSSPGRYVIMEEDDLLEGLPPDQKDRNSLQNNLNKLQESGWIDVRYSRGELFCLAPLKIWKEESTKQPSATREPIIKYWWFGLITLSSFLGSLLANLIC